MDMGNIFCIDSLENHFIVNLRYDSNMSVRRFVNVRRDVN